MSTWIVLIGCALLAGCWLGWQLLRQNGRILLRLDELDKRLNELEFGQGDEPEGLPVGSEAPAFELPDLSGERKSLVQFPGQPLLLIFFHPDCGFCRDLVPRLAAIHKQTLEGRGQNEESKEHPLVLIITTGEAVANHHLLDEHQVTCPVLLQKEMEVATAYQANGTPSGYLISTDGKIASELAIGADAVLALTARKSEVEPDAVSGVAGNGDGRANRFGNRSLARSKIKRDGLKAGAPAPDFRLPRLDGDGELALSDLRGKRVLLVFSSPDCGPCNTLAPELEKFHRQHPELELVMISKGEPKENRAKVKEHGLTFPIVMQQQWEISRKYAMFATPIAHLIDEAGVVVANVAVGADAIQELMSRLIGRGLEKTAALPSCR